MRVRGEAAPLLIELEDPVQQKIYFMEMRPNQSRMQEVNIFNNSKIPLMINFDVGAQLADLNGLSISLS